MRFWGLVGSSSAWMKVDDIPIREKPAARRAWTIFILRSEVTQLISTALPMVWLDVPGRFISFSCDGERKAEVSMNGIPAICRALFSF